MNSINLKQTILLIDANEGLRQLISFVLEEQDYQVIPVSSGIIGLKWIYTGNSPACILLDANITDIPALDLLEQLHFNNLIGATPIIVLAAEQDEPIKEYCYNSGTTFLTKPFNPSQLSQLIQELTAVAEEIQSL